MITRVFAHGRSQKSRRVARLVFRVVALTFLSLGAGGPFAQAQVQLRVTVLGRPGDIRVAAVQEAVAFWNQQLDRVGENVRLGPVRVVDDSAAERILSDLSAAIMSGRSEDSLAPLIAQVPGEIIIAMSSADLMSFGVPWHDGAKGFVALRRADVPPLSLPNVARNAVAHELGHILGLSHNANPSTLMCGRPAPCRPDLFASDTVHFFPLTPSEEQQLREHCAQIVASDRLGDR